MKLLLSSIFLGFAFVFAEEDIRLMKWIQTQVPDSAIKPPGKVNLKYGVALLAIDPPEIKPGQEMIEMRFSLWERMLWTDSRLAWRESDFDGQGVMRVPCDRMWKPDIMFLNKHDAKALDTNVVVFSSGEVLHIRPVTLSQRCFLQNNGFYRCNFKVLSWTYDGNQISPTFYEGKKSVDMTDYEPTPGISVIDTPLDVVSVTYPCCPEPYPHVDFNVTVRIDA